MEQKIIEEADLDGILGLLSSTDPENRVIAWTILEQCNMPVSLPWLIVIFRMIDDTLRVELMKGNNCEELWKYLSSVLKIESAPQYFTSQECYTALKQCANNEAAITYLEKDYAKRLRKQMIMWGYDLLKDYELTLTRI